MSPAQAKERAWPEIAVQLLREVQEGRHATNDLRVELKGEICELRQDLAVHKVKTNRMSAIASGITTAVMLALYWVSGNKGG